MPLQWINRSAVAWCQWITGQKDGTFVTILLCSWQRTRSALSAARLTVKCATEGAGESSPAHEVWLKSSSVPASTCHRHGQFPHVKTMYNV